MKQRMLLVVLCGILLFSMLTGCSAVGMADKSNSTAAYTPMAQGENELVQQDTDTGEAGFSASSAMAPANLSVDRKIIWTVDMEVETLTFDAFLSSLEEAVQTFGGYMEGSSISGDSIQYTSNRYGTLTIRIPSGKLDDFLSQVGQIGTVTYTNKSSEDVTLDYVDIESRIATLKVEQERLLALLESAQDLESVIQLESRLSEVRYQLESYTSTQNRYDSLIDYSTVSLSVREVQRVTAVHDQSVGQRIAAGWSETIYQLKNGVVDFFVWFVVNLPYLLIWALFAGLILWFCLRYTKKRRSQKTDSRPTGPNPPAPGK
ncbi:MAG: DUF4349 domain-containing protein [Oscillospiraceae bacterium]|nr:DUF4349 domain-containing protein [Oscillospiraceae bacterium]